MTTKPFHSLALLSNAFILLLFGMVLRCDSIAAEEYADKIWTGGTIITMNDDQMRVEAIAIKDGKILNLGTNDKVMKHKGPVTKVSNLDGKSLMPGFVDAHGHMMMGGIQALTANLLPPPDGGVTDIASLQDTLREWIIANKKVVTEVDLIIGFGYDNSLIKERRHPTRADLDQVSKDVAIITIHQSGHLFAVNSKALEICGISSATSDPAGGKIRRESDGKTPNGVLEETAGFPVLFKLLSRIGKERAEFFVTAGSDLWAKYGYTTAQEGRALPAIIDIIKKVAANGKLKVDVAIYPDVLISRDVIKSLVSKNYQNRVRVAGAKLTIDGSVQGFTAWRDKPYFDPVGEYPPGYVGYPAATKEQVGDAIDWAFANNIQIQTHSNGEAASDQLIAFISEAEKKYGSSDRRPVLIHGQLLREDQVDSLNRLKIFPSLFPMHTFYWGDWHRDHSVGPEASNNISPTGWCIKRGMKFSSHHDAPVAFPNSMRVLDSTVTRRSRSGDIIGASQRVDVITALKAMTIWPAYQHFEEDKKGSIEVGKLADLVILSKDPTSVDPDTLDEIKVLETIKEGTTIFSSANEKTNLASLAGTSSTSGKNSYQNFLSALADNTSGSHSDCPSSGINSLIHAIVG